jgi:hypothetical protein
VAIGHADDALPGDAVVTTPAQCDPITAAELERLNVAVVILAPVFRLDERARYQRAGAEYLVMSIENNRLLLEYLDKRWSQSVLATAARAAATHRSSPNFSAW